MPDQHMVLVEARQDRGPFLGSLPKFGASVNDFYRIEAKPSTRMLGRPARAIAVTPKDQFRFGYRLWLDETTAMPLKTQLCDSQGKVIEQIVFARLDMPESIPDSELKPTVRTQGMRWVRQGAPQGAASAALSAYRASELPPGFHLTVAGAQTLGGARCRPVTWYIRMDWPPYRCSSKRRREPAERAGERCATRRGAAHGRPDAGWARDTHSRWSYKVIGDCRGRGARADRRVHRPLGQISSGGELPQPHPESLSHTQSGSDGVRRFQLYSRPAAASARRCCSPSPRCRRRPSIGVDVIDVDREAASRARYGHKIPVLLLGGELVCHGRLDPKNYIRPSFIIADRYNRGFAHSGSRGIPKQAPGVDEEYPQFFHHCPC